MMDTRFGHPIPSREQLSAVQQYNSSFQFSEGHRGQTENKWMMVFSPVVEKTKMKMQMSRFEVTASLCPLCHHLHVLPFSLSAILLSLSNSTFICVKI